MEIPTLLELREDYRSLDKRLAELEDSDPSNLLVSFPLATMMEENWPAASLVNCEFHELSAICPWTNMPDQGTIVLEYVPDVDLLELKSYKYYLLAFRDRHITQEHLAQKVYNDLWSKLSPKALRVTLDYMPRGGIHTTFVLSSEALGQAHIP